MTNKHIKPKDQSRGSSHTEANLMAKKINLRFVHNTKYAYCKSRCKQKNGRYSDRAYNRVQYISAVHNKVTKRRQISA